jgi:uncharacterized protein YecT (DUF1311 family)
MANIRPRPARTQTTERCHSSLLLPAFKHLENTFAPFRTVATTIVLGHLLTNCSRSTQSDYSDRVNSAKECPSLQAPVTHAIGGKRNFTEGTVVSQTPTSPNPLASSLTAPAATDNPSCLQTVAGQAQLNDCASDTARIAELSMQRLVDSILKQHASDAVFVRKFTAAHAAWLRYRDAELAARFPAENPQAEYGSMFPMCWGLEHARLSRERIRLLKLWSELAPAESEVCQGSY